MPGYVNNSGFGFSEKAVPALAAIMTTIPQGAAKELSGQCDFIKRSTGDIIYIGLCGKKPTSTNYDIILTDTVPYFDLQVVPVGDIQALSSSGAGILSAIILTCS